MTESMTNSVDELEAHFANQVVLFYGISGGAITLEKHLSTVRNMRDQLMLSQAAAQDLQRQLDAMRSKKGRK